MTHDFPHHRHQLGATRFRLSGFLVLLLRTPPVALYRWEERARAYDEEVQAQRRRDQEAAIEEMNERHIKISQAIQGKVVQWRASYDGARLKPHEAERLITTAAALDRAARDDVPAELRRLARMSTEELISRYAHLTHAPALTPAAPRAPQNEERDDPAPAD